MFNNFCSGETDNDGEGKSSELQSSKDNVWCCFHPQVINSIL